MKKIELRNLVIIAVLAALGAILRLASVPIMGESNKIVFHNIPIMLSSLAFGPIAGVVTGIIVDLTSLFYQPGWNPLYSVAYIMWGLIPGVLKYVVNHRKVWGLVIIEFVAHLLASTANRLAGMFVRGFEVAFIPVNVEEFQFFIPFLTDFIKLFAINGIIYVGVAVAIVMMLIKIPIDVVILKILNKRVVDTMILKKDFTEL